MATRLVLFFFGAIVLFAEAAWTQNIDQAEIELRRIAGAPLRWDNVEGAPFWLAGKAPSYSLRRGVHTFVLGSAQFALIRLPRGESLRLVSEGRKLAPTDIDLMVSNGSGLFLQFDPLPVQDGSLAFVPDINEELVVKLSLPERRKDPMEFAVYVSRHEWEARGIDYRSEVSLDAPLHRISSSSGSGEENFVRLESGASLPFSATGPARVSLETRFVYGENESGDFQTYWLDVYINGVFHDAVEFLTRSEVRQQLSVDGKPAVLGRLMRGFIDIPAGEARIELRTRTPVFLRVRAHGSEYLLPSLNEPKPTVAELTQRDLLSRGKTGHWGVDEVQAAKLAHDSRPISARELLAYQLVKDNRYLESALQGWMLLAQPAKGEDEVVASTAEQVRAWGTFYRNLLPGRRASEERQISGWFLQRQLQPLFGSSQERAIAEQHLEDNLSRVSFAQFLPLPAPGEEAEHYSIPPRPASSTIRLAVDRRSVRDACEFMIQIDGRSAKKARFAPEFVRSMNEFQTSTAEAALFLLSPETELPFRGTESGPFSSFAAAGELVEAATFEFLIPQSVKTVSLSNISAGSSVMAGQPRVALQYRSAKTYKMSESEYYSACAALSSEMPPTELFFALLQRRTAADGNVPRAQRELENHWLPLLRDLLASEEELTSRVAGQSVLLRDSANCEKDLLQAQGLKERGAEIEAIALWRRAVEADRASCREQAVESLGQTLFKQGEFLLGENVLLGTALSDNDRSVRQTAYALLAEHYQKTGQTDALERFAEAYLLHSPSEEALRDTAAVLLENGKTEHALALLLLVDKAGNEDLLLKASLLSGWKETFSRISRNLPDGQSQQWQAVDFARRGEIGKAQQLFADSGIESASLFRYVEAGLEIRRQLSDRDLSKRLQAVFDWERWQESFPGSMSFHEEPGLVTAYSGSLRVMRLDNARHSQYYRAEKNRPLEVEIQGPADIRFEFRPLHGPGSLAPLDTWVEVRESEAVTLVPIFNDLPMPDLVSAEATGEGIGAAEEKHMWFGPGLHRLRISPQEHPLLVRVFAKRPEIGLGLLPALTPQAVRSVLKGRLEQAAEEPLSLVEPVEVAIVRPGSLRTVSFVPGSLASNRGAEAPIDLSGLSQVDQARAALRLGDETAIARAVEKGLFAEDQLSCGEQISLAMASERGHLLLAGGHCASLPESILARQALLVGHGKIEDALHLPDLSDEGVRQARMVLIARLAEQSPAQFALAVKEADKTWTSRPIPALRKLWLHVVQGAPFVAARSVEKSAGIRNLSLPSWQPESPELRTRRALLSDKASGRQALLGSDRLVFPLEGISGQSLILSYELDVPLHSTLLPFDVKYRTDEGQERTIAVRDGSRQGKVQIEVDAGRRFLEVWSANQPVNHFLFVSLNQLTADGVKQLEFPLQERTYQLATEKEPLVVRLSGPVSIRIDEFRDDVVFSSYRFFESGEHVLKLAPPQGRTEALYRVSLRERASAVETPPLRASQVSEAERREFAMQIQSADVTSYRAEDNYSLGGQEDGTIAAGFGVVHRRLFDESGDTMTASDEFIEFNAAHRYASLSGNRYFMTEPLLRLNREERPTFGLNQEIDFRPRESSLSFGLSGSAFFQHEHALEHASGEDSEWSLQGRGTVRQLIGLSESALNLPSLSVFGRALSLDEEDPVLAGSLDQDVYTKYKAEHRYGLMLQDVFYYSPWLDTRMSAGASLTTNEDFDPMDPDSLGFAGGLDQLFGPLELDLGYQLKRFFTDQDRRSESTRSSVLAGLILNVWPAEGSLVEISARIRQDLDDGETSGSVFLTWYECNGRLYRDFEPGDISFRHLKTRQFGGANNHFIPLSKDVAEGRE